MSGGIERELRERLQAADLPNAPEQLRMSLEAVVRTPHERRSRPDGRRVLRVMAVAAAIATGALAAVTAGGGPTRNAAIVPNPSQTTGPTAPMSALSLANLAGLPDGLASTCKDASGAFQDIAPVGASIRCAEHGVTIEVAQVSVLGESGDPITASDVWNRLAYRPIAETSGESPWIRSDESICSSKEIASYSDYAVGTRPAGRIGGCTDNSWLSWTIDRHEVVARIELASGSLEDAVSWFRTNRPVGGHSGLIWEVPWYACPEDATVPGCDGPLPREAFETIWLLARPVTYEELMSTAPESSGGELVRLSGRVAFGYVDDGWTGIEVRRISGADWDQTVMIPEAYLAGPRNGDIIDVVGWVGERFAMPGSSEPDRPIGPTPATSLPASLPHVDVAAYRSSE